MEKVTDTVSVTPHPPQTLKKKPPLVKRATTKQKTTLRPFFSLQQCHHRDHIGITVTDTVTVTWREKEEKREEKTRVVS